MAGFSVWMLESSKISVSGGGSLSGITQGDGSHLVGRSITLGSKAWHETRIQDDDKSFDDNDGTQRLDGTQVIDGTKYAGGTVVEAEYRLRLVDPASGRTWDVYGYNVNNSNPAFATIEGLAFFGGAAGFPPVGIPLRVQSATEGPGSSGQGAIRFDQLAYPPCFTPGTAILTPQGDRPVETLAAGDLVMTRDAGPQPLLWVGRMEVSGPALAATPRFWPIRIPAGALGGGLPRRTLHVSPQHRMLLGGWKSELLFGQPEVLVAAIHLARTNPRIRVDTPPEGVSYLHLLLERHHVLWAEGAQTESLHPAALHQPGLRGAHFDELRSVFPDLQACGPAARICLSGPEATTLAA